MMKTVVLLNIFVETVIQKNKMSLKCNFSNNVNVILAVAISI